MELGNDKDLLADNHTLGVECGVPFFRIFSGGDIFTIPTMGDYPHKKKRRNDRLDTHSYADTHRHLIIEHAIEHPNSSVVFRTICH